MPLPIIRGIIDRRILVNYRVDPEVLSKVLPEPFRPLTIHGHGMAGICLIRLKQVRPRFLPGWVGTASENAAHRIAVQWEQNGDLCEGVYVPRRDTSSRLNTLLGGRLFPGVHHLGRLQINEQSGRYRVSLHGDDGLYLTVEGRQTSKWPERSVFRTIEEASAFFERGAVGYSPTARTSASGNPSEFEGLELRTSNWRVEPLAIDKVESSYFEHEPTFPKGSVEFDSALLMRGIRHEWHVRPTIECCEQPGTGLQERLQIALPEGGRLAS
ncbi:MAG TPA: DUF2071 domain-containing protein [Planctomycetaceae bacterium]|jgi:hypothetical protein|nr:DUF2071 domain-containing protein [Planctomycetaceae bacterium]